MLKMEESKKYNTVNKIMGSKVTIVLCLMFLIGSVVAMSTNYGNFHIDGNITSDYFIGDGSLLNNVGGTVVASVSWNANTESSGEATLDYRTNHLRVFRLAPGIWSIENMGTNPLMPGDSSDWIVNSMGGGIGDPFFLTETNIVALGQPSIGHPVTISISATSLSASPNTGNLGSIILKIRDKDGVVVDPTLADAYATIKFIYIE